MKLTDHHRRHGDTHVCISYSHISFHSNLTFVNNQAQGRTGARAGALYLFANGTFIVER
jgi:hypothetical protein